MTSTAPRASLENRSTLLFIRVLMNSFSSAANSGNKFSTDKNALVDLIFRKTERPGFATRALRHYDIECPTCTKL